MKRHNWMSPQMEEHEDKPESVDELEEEEGKSATMKEDLAPAQVGIYNEELYPFKLQWGKPSSCSVVSIAHAEDVAHAPDSDVYQVGDPVYFHKAANLGGATGMADLQQRWFVVEVVEVVTEEPGFRLYRVRNGGRGSTEGEQELAQEESALMATASS